jgi:hypothetical protein
MCQSYRKTCHCGNQTAEIFFGRMILDENSVAHIYCPECSSGVEKEEKNRVWDNGWLLELNLEAVRPKGSVMGLSPEEITAERIFDEGFVTWVGITPNESKQRDEERLEIQKLAATDLKAYLQAMKDWGAAREKRFSREGWRKMRTARKAA